MNTSIVHLKDMISNHIVTNPNGLSHVLNSASSLPIKPVTSGEPRMALTVNPLFVRAVYSGAVTEKNSIQRQYSYHYRIKEMVPQTFGKGKTKL